MDFWLASSSPRRKELLEQVGYRFNAFSVDVDESPSPAEDPKAYVLRLARTKAIAGAQQKPGIAVLGSDTTVTIDNHILGKPENEDDFQRMMGLLSGRSHHVHTGVAVCLDERVESVISTTVVRFGALNDDLVSAYWRSGEPLGKAGGYAIQGFAAVFVESIEGSYSGVVGLPLYETRQLLSSFGVEPWRVENKQ